MLAARSLIRSNPWTPGAFAAGVRKERLRCVKVVLTCPSCQKDYPVDTGIFQCPAARPGEEHTLRRVLPPGTDTMKRNPLRLVFRVRADRSTPLRPTLSSFRLLGEDRYRRVLNTISERLQILEGRDFQVTPLTEAPGLATDVGRSGPLWIKNETGNVTGSHKGRHLMATLLYLEALREIRGRNRPQGARHIQLRERRAGSFRRGQGQAGTNCTPSSPKTSIRR